MYTRPANLLGLLPNKTLCQECKGQKVIAYTFWVGFVVTFIEHPNPDPEHCFVVNTPFPPPIPRMKVGAGGGGGGGGGVSNLNHCPGFVQKVSCELVNVLYQNLVW